MGSHKFTSGPPDDQFTIPLTPPPGATALVIRAVLHRPTSPDNATYRLLHLRRKGVTRTSMSEICELLLNNTTGIFTAAFSGLGQKHAKVQPQHLGKVQGQDIPVTMTVPLPGAPTMTASIAVGPLAGSAVPDLATMQKQDNSGPAWGHDDTLELVLGFEGPGDLKAPAGWEISWADDGSAVQWVGAQTQPTPTPTPTPTIPLPVPIRPPVEPPPVLPKPPELETPSTAPTTPTVSLRSKFVADLKALVVVYGTAEAEAAGIDPLWIFFVQALLSRVKV